MKNAIFTKGLEVKNRMNKESELSRRKFMEIGISGICGNIAVVSTIATARFSVDPSFRKKENLRMM